MTKFEQMFVDALRDPGCVIEILRGNNNYGESDFVSIEVNGKCVYYDTCSAFVGDFARLRKFLI